MTWFKKGDRVKIWTSMSNRINILGTVTGIIDPYKGIKVDWDEKDYGPGVFEYNQLQLIYDPNDILKGML